MKLNRYSLALCSILLFTSLLGSAVFSPGKAIALNLNHGCGQGSATIFGFPAWDDCLPHTNDPSHEVVIESLNDLWLVVIPLVESLIRAAGYISVGFVIWGGIIFVKSQGDPGKVTAARETIRDSLIGLGIAISAIAIVQYVAGKF